MRTPPADLDDARRSIAASDLVADASNHLTEDLYHSLEFSDLVAVKNLLKRFFSAQPWGDDDADRLAMLITRNVEETNGWFEHDLGAGMTLLHGFDAGVYRLWATGTSESPASVFDRVFAGPVQPEATPNPRHVRFVLGGTPAPGVWYRPGDDIPDGRVETLLADEDVTDVLVAGDFVAIGLRRPTMWEARLDDLLDTVTELFWSEDRKFGTVDGPTRDELVSGGTGRALHLLNPDDPASRVTLEEALTDDDPRRRRMAAATLAQSADESYAVAVLERTFADPSRIVRRTVVDAAVDLESPGVRRLLEDALGDEDDWIRWKAVKGLSEIGLESSAAAVARLRDDPDFQVRFEVESALRQS